MRREMAPGYSFLEALGAVVWIVLCFCAGYCVYLVSQSKERQRWPDEGW
jgi:tryptophan-rich sensory protein